MQGLAECIRDSIRGDLVFNTVASKNSITEHKFITIFSQRVLWFFFLYRGIDTASLG